MEHVLKAVPLELLNGRVLRVTEERQAVRNSDVNDTKGSVLASIHTQTGEKIRSVSFIDNRWVGSRAVKDMMDF